MTDLEKELFDALQGVLPYLSLVGDTHHSLAVYIPYAQQLRNQADAYDKQEKAILQARNLAISLETRREGKE